MTNEAQLILVWGGGDGGGFGVGRLKQGRRLQGGELGEQSGERNKMTSSQQMAKRGGGVRRDKLGVGGGGEFASQVSPSRHPFTR